MNTYIESILNDFEPITLHEMDNVSLMKRKEKKFVFHIKQLPLFLDEIYPYYKVLNINGVVINRYETLYYDTPDFKMYLQHQNGRARRLKVRFRKYVESNQNYFEIKLKTNKKETIKERIKTDCNRITFSEKEERLLTSETHFIANDLKPILWTNCSRITLVNKDESERLTIDINLVLKDENNQKCLSEIVIAEMKQGTISNTAFKNLMLKNRIDSMPISKYCLGVAFLHSEIKSNNFKPKLLTLNKLCHDFS